MIKIGKLTRYDTPKKLSNRQDPDQVFSQICHFDKSDYDPVGNNKAFFNLTVPLGLIYAGLRMGHIFWGGGELEAKQYENNILRPFLRRQERRSPPPSFQRYFICVMHMCY